MENTKDTVLYEGRHVNLVSANGWEFARRKKVSGIVGILAVTVDGKIVLVEQHRPPVGCSVIEIPAGLAGDVDGHEHEHLAEAARRELLEETGYEAQHMEFLADGAASAGITDEIIAVFRATELARRNAGGGDSSESITVHEVPLAGVEDWLAAQRQAGKLVDLKVYAALHFARCR